MIHFNLHRFGVDEFAVGQLINGDLPEDDEERWRILDAPRWHIKRLFDEHRDAQQVLRDCRDSGRRFVVFLRTFRAEHRGERQGAAISSMVTTHSLALQRALHDTLAPQAVPLVKLHGGSDPLIAAFGGGDAHVLSTHESNWVGVVDDLVRSASAVVLLLGDASAGVAQELELIARAGRQDSCLVLRLAGSQVPPGFAHVFDFDSNESAVPPELFPTLTAIIARPAPAPQVEAALAARFIYCEPDWIDSPDHVETEKRLWLGLRMLRVLLDSGYWEALRTAGVDISEFTFPGAWTEVHKLYGLGLAACDFKAIHESLSLLFPLYIKRGADFALLIPILQNQYDELAAEIGTDAAPSTEERYAEGPDPLAKPPSVRWASDLFVAAHSSAQRGDITTANYLFQASIISALRAEAEDDRVRRATLGQFCGEWAKAQWKAKQISWARANFLYAVALFRDLASEDPDGVHRSALALTLNNLAAMFHSIGDFGPAETTYDEVLTLRRELAQRDASERDNLANSLGNKGLLMAQTSRPAQARTLYEEAIALSRNAQIRERVQAWVAELPAASE